MPHMTATPSSDDSPEPAEYAIDQPIDVLLWHGVSEWAVITWGTEYLGCGLVRSAVRKDLFGTATCF